MILIQLNFTLLFSSISPFSVITSMIVFGGKTKRQNIIFGIDSLLNDYA